MSKQVFILDRPDFIRASAILPEDADRDRLAEALRETHDAYGAHRARKHSLAQEVATGTVSIELLAEQAAWPSEMEKLSLAYFRALLAWAKHTRQSFEVVHNDAVDAINSNYDAWRTATARIDRFGPASPEGQEATRQLATIRKEDQPHIVKRDRARYGRGAVETYVHQVTKQPMRLADERAYMRQVRATIKEAA